MPEARVDRRRLSVRLLQVAPVPVVAIAVAVIVVTTLSGANTATSRGSVRPAVTDTSDGAAPSEPRGLRLGWVGDITPGSQYGVPDGDGRSLFADFHRELHEPAIMAGNLEGTLSVGGSSKCGPGAPNCFAFQAPPGNAVGLAAAGFDLLNVANNHAFDYGADGQRQTLDALAGAGIAVTGTPGTIRVVGAGRRSVAFVGFASYPWAAPLNDPPAVAGLVRAADRRAHHVVVLFHGGAEGSDRTHVPVGRELHLGEDRGDLRAFARAAIDAGADAVLGSGPHVLRGLELYRDRLVAYSLGNFAGVHNFATTGTLALSAVLEARLAPDGRFAGGRLHPAVLDASGRPTRDPSRAAVALVRELSVADFGAGAPRITDAGRILAPAGGGDPGR